MNSSGNVVKHNTVEWTNSNYAKVAMGIEEDEGNTTPYDYLDGNRSIPFANFLDPSNVVITGGTGYHQATTTCAITGGTAIVAATCLPIVTAGVITAVQFPIIGNYSSAATGITFTDTNVSPGTGASATITQLASGPFISNDVFSSSYGNTLRISNIGVVDGATLQVTTPSSLPSNGTTYCFSGISIFGATAPGTSGAPLLPGPQAQLNGECGLVSQSGTTPNSATQFTDHARFRLHDGGGWYMASNPNCFSGGCTAYVEGLFKRNNPRL